MIGQQLFEAQARVTDPDTSHQAAKSVQVFTETHAAIYAMVEAFGPVSDEDIKTYMDRAHIAVSDSGCRTRRSELVRGDKLEDSKLRGLTRSGRSTILWQITR